jgi:hypothetical protein
MKININSYFDLFFEWVHHDEENMSNCDVQIYIKLHVILNNDGIKESLVKS